MSPYYFFAITLLSANLLLLETEALLLRNVVSIANGVIVPSLHKSVWRRVHILPRRYQDRPLSPLYVGTNDINDDSDATEDWRDVRAKLIQQYRRSENSEDTLLSSSTNTTASVAQTTMKTTPPTTIKTKWAYDSGDVVERGSLIVSHPVQDFACGGLKQQYFHKCVVLVVKHDAHFTKGVILNRPTQRKKLKDSHDNEWTVWFAGDVQGLHSPHPDYTCLHRLKSPKALEMSLPVVKDIQHTTWELAQLLVQSGEAKPDDFWLGCGYAGWWPKQLQEELERGNWFIVATDSESISELLSSSGPSRVDGGTENNIINDTTTECETGIAMWHEFMARIGKAHLVEEYSTQQGFEDTMLTEWVHERLMPSRLEQLEKDRAVKNGLIIQPQDDETPNAAPAIQEGTIYRTRHRILLDEQVFHESLVLILKSDHRGIIGAILNRPSSKTAGFIKDKRLPLRYGGRYGLGGEGKPETWLHCGNPALRNARVGVPIVPEDESLVWQCSREDAETAVEIGLAAPSDFMVVLGLTLWEKNPPPEGFGIPLTKTNLVKDFMPVPRSAIPHLWKELLNQEMLTEDSFSKNLGHAKVAYHLASNSAFDLVNDIPDLADDALERWIKRFLMKDEEIKNA